MSRDTDQQHTTSAVHVYMTLSCTDNLLCVRADGGMSCLMETPVYVLGGLHKYVANTLDWRPPDDMVRQRHNSKPLTTMRQFKDNDSSIAVWNYLR